VNRINIELPKRSGSRWLRALNSVPMAKREKLLEGFYEFDQIAREMPPLHAVLAGLVTAELYLPKIADAPEHPTVSIKTLRDFAILLLEHEVAKCADR
jgi:hypothetical protein